MDILYSIRTFSKLSGNSLANNEHVAKTFRIRKNFPVSIDDALTGFFWLCGHLKALSVLISDRPDLNCTFWFFLPDSTKVDLGCGMSGCLINNIMCADVVLFTLHFTLFCKLQVALGWFCTECKTVISSCLTFHFRQEQNTYSTKPVTSCLFTLAAFHFWQEQNMHSTKYVISCLSSLAAFHFWQLKNMYSIKTCHSRSLYFESFSFLTGTKHANLRHLWQMFPNMLCFFHAIALVMSKSD